MAGWPQSFCGHPVLRVVDGDTLVVRVSGKPEKIRLLNVDTPESVHPDKKRNTPMGKAASAYIRSRLEGKTVCLEFEAEKRGKYGRLLAYVIRDSQNINLELVRLGWSPYYTKYGTSPRYHEAFTEAQTRARSLGLGIWARETQPASEKHAALLPKTDSGPYRGNTQSLIFHRPDCRWYACTHCTRIFSTPQEAIEKGYRPCSICRP